MFVSMTGFARKEVTAGPFQAILQIKSYNNRYLDLAISLPPPLAAREGEAQSLLSSRISRGKVEFSIRLKRSSAAPERSVNAEQARKAYESLRRIAEACGIAEQPTLSLVAAQEGVFSAEEDAEYEEIWPMLLSAIETLLEEFQHTRRREGSATWDNVFRERARLAAGLERVKADSAGIEDALGKQLKARFAEFLPGGADEQRVLQEIAAQLIKFGINEELSRLDAHLSAFSEIAKTDSPAKKLDFLCQEMNREVNTIGSKNMLVSVAHTVVDMKDALENIREQLRNVE